MEEIDPRLAHARKLLNKFQTKQHEVKPEEEHVYMLQQQYQPSPPQYQTPPVQQFQQNLQSPQQYQAPNPQQQYQALQTVNQNQYLGQEPSAQPSFSNSAVFVNGSATESNVPSLHSSRSSSFVNVSHSEHGVNGTSEVNHLRHSLADKDKQLNETLTKLQSLHNHYAQLHDAYNKLVNESSTNQRLDEVNKQVTQLQTALTVAVQEKTQLQIDLRNINAHLKAVEVEFDIFKKQHGNGGTQNHEYQNAHLLEENKKLSERVSSQAAAIAQQRKECSALEAQVVIVNQDKNDVQARLKYVYQEKEELQQAISQLKHELSMKEIYIRQFSKGTGDDQGQKTVELLSAEKTQLEGQNVQLQQQIIVLKQESEGTRHHFESCLNQAQDRINVLEEQLKTLTEQRNDSETTKFYLQEELEMFRKQTQQSLAKTDSDQTESQVSVVTATESDSVPRIEFEASKNSYQKLERDFNEQAAFITELNKAIDERDQRVSNLTKLLEDSTKKAQRLEEQLEKNDRISSDIVQLSEQLQNERATVSRAVSQNMELKEQLGELQDKFIEVTNQSMQSEDEKQRAIMTITRLSKRIEELEVDVTVEQARYKRNIEGKSKEEVEKVHHVYENSVDEVTDQSTMECAFQFLEAGVEELEKLLNIMKTKSDEERAEGYEIMQAFYKELKQVFMEHGVIREDKDTSSSSGLLTETTEKSTQDELVKVLVHQRQQTEISHSTTHAGTDAPLPTPNREQPVSRAEPVEVAAEAQPEQQFVNQHSPNNLQPPHHHEVYPSDHSSDESESENEDGYEHQQHYSSDDLHRNLVNFLDHPEPQESAMMQYFRHVYLKMERELKMLYDEQGVAKQEAEDLKQQNSKLQYWLTHVESENESIGDFIELYRSQREKIQSKVKEKEQECDDLKTQYSQLQNNLKQLCVVLVSSIQTKLQNEVQSSESLENAENGQPSDSQEHSHDVAPEKCQIHNLTELLIRLSKSNDSTAASPHEFTQLLNDLSSFDFALHCQECRGALKHL